MSRTDAVITASVRDRARWSASEHLLPAAGELIGAAVAVEQAGRLLLLDARDRLDGPAQTMLSYVPPASAILMPQRVLEGSAQWWEPLVALGILAVAAGAVVLLAERLYRRSLLQTQGRLSMRQAWSAPE